MSVAELTTPVSRAKRLKAGTHTEHDQVDNLVMGSRPFESLERYALFLRLQYQFHGALRDLYSDVDLNRQLPGLANLSRFQAVEADLRDLDLPVPNAPQAAPVTSPYAALGWLYCSEGSNLGAAFLFKETKRLDLDETHGARHLAAHEVGRAQNWRAFVAQLDAIELTPEQDQQVIAGACAAFDFYRSALNQVFH
ncbi:biliverdin-producing heme oxygenase [Pseudomonas sp. FW300-N2F2]|uniref:biliverdin-producing heme oxygenase n=1 Tax=Pseudomonas sp. FW300-N2F2 TaxID=2751320 RepID=UPI001A91B953|nr:biliverdin-producing heme oxygenase [Pseudomonas sp. FW300-N2F2]